MGFNSGFKGLIVPFHQSFNQLVSSLEVLRSKLRMHLSVCHRSWIFYPPHPKICPPLILNVHHVLKFYPDRTGKQ